MKKQKEEGIGRLPDSELAIMQIIWEAKEPVGTGYLADILGREREWSRSTVQVLLARLEEKKFVSFQKKGRLKFYEPLVSQEVYRQSETKTFLEQFYHNSYKGLVTALVQEEKLSREDIQEIMEMIQADES
ncbi:MAG TPA: transcriptional regulator [Lachnospiraceae bacterium]|nr:transcriptional regulator [Lachnospiraceae bacterium]